MKFEVSTGYLDPIDLGRNEWVSVRLPGGRVVTVYHDSIHVQTEQEVLDRKSGQKVWTGTPNLVAWPHGRTYEQHSADDAPEEELPDPRVQIEAACRRCIWRQRGPYNRTWSRMVQHAAESGHIIEWNEVRGPLGDFVISRADRLAENAEISRLLSASQEPELGSGSGSPSQTEKGQP
jgi:hypothetical protein